MSNAPESPVIHEAYARWDRAGWSGMPEQDAAITHRLCFADWGLEVEARAFPYRMKRQTWDRWRVWFGICQEGPSSRIGRILDDEPDQFWGHELPPAGAVLALRLSMDEPDQEASANVLDRAIAHTLYAVGQTPDDIAIVAPLPAGHLQVQRMGFRPLVEDDTSLGFWRRLGDQPLAWPDLVPAGLGFTAEEPRDT